MNRAIIALLTCDKIELTERSIKPLLAGQGYDLQIVDGSKTQAGRDAAVTLGYPQARPYGNVTGGAGAAIVFALTTMLGLPEQYEWVGLCEQDVVLPDDWWQQCCVAVDRAAADGLDVGAVSARCYRDRMLFAREGYAAMHNLGAGHVMFTRWAAQIVLDNFRTAWTLDNRRIFAQLTGEDIGPYWAFRYGEHPLTADWHWEVSLAARGLAAIAVTPSHVEMIGQDPPLADQGLELVTEPVRSPLPDAAFDIYKTRLLRIRTLQARLGVETTFWHDPSGVWTCFPHQINRLGGTYQGEWRSRENRGWGTWIWEAGAANDSLSVQLFGTVTLLVSGGENGGKVEVLDEGSGLRVQPELIAEGAGSSVLQISVPGAMSYRTIRLTALVPGIRFYGIQTRDRQPENWLAKFDHSVLAVPCPSR